MTEINADALPVIPDIVRIQEDTKPGLQKLMALEKRKIGPTVSLLLNEYVNIKIKVHEQHFLFNRIQVDQDRYVQTARYSVEGGSVGYQKNPLLRIDIQNSDADLLNEPFFLNKENALTLMANISMFLNEVNR